MTATEAPAVTPAAAAAPMAAAGPGSPPTVAHGVVRPAVLAVLDGRWAHAVTTVVAGAGFGKSIALGQAVRANQARPRGVEAWVSCRSGCEEPARLAETVRRAFGLGASSRAVPPAVAVRDALAAHAPVAATLVLDDVEALDELPACLDALDSALRVLPAGAHVVLAGRAVPPLRLARLRAAGQVLDVGEDDLRFTDADIAALAARLGVPVPDRDLGGWPALVRLALTSPAGVDEFLGEEVVAALAPDDRRALVALTVLGPSAPADVAAVTGRPFDGDGFCARVPLVHRAGDAVVAHGLWEPARDLLASPAELAEASRRALAVVSGRGDPVATGALALRLGDREALAAAAVALVRSTLGTLPVGVADAWLAAGADDPAGEAARQPEPGLDLLACARHHVDDPAAPSAARLDALMARFRAAGDRAGESVALALGALAADATDDLGRLMTLAVQARELSGLSDDPDPIVRLLVAAVDGALAAVAGDLVGAVGHLEAPIPGLAPGDRPEALVRLQWHLLILTGRAGDAARLVGEASGPGTPLPVAERPLEAVARWFDGDPSGLLPGHVDVAPGYEGLSERDRFDRAAIVAGLAACAGVTEAVDQAVGILEAYPLAEAVPADAAFVAAGRAARCVARHDEDGAAAVLAAFLDRYEPLDGVADAHLRRSPAVGYVLAPALHARWDAADLGPSLRRARAVARLLVDARAGRPVGQGPDDLAAVGTALPLPWSVELAARAAGAGAGWGAALAEDLSDRFGAPVDAELDRLAAAGDRVVRRGAEAIRRALPARPAGTVEVHVLGPLEVWRDGAPVDSPELRRARVRELLSVLAVERTITRDRAVDLLWGDLDVDAARANLRVTLGHLRRLLEPGRPAGAAAYFVRADATHVRLAAVEGLSVDLWALEDDLAAADEARRAGDADGRAGALRAATDRWRGRPLPDLDAVDDLAPHARHVAGRLSAAVAALGELELVGGGLAEAAGCAARALAADPYDERAHRLAIAAPLQGRDRAAATAAIGRLRGGLDELGAEPEESTAMLLRQAEAWLGPRPGAEAEVP
jgi:LuxR family transcriptional regulator, maltose regulon positive regulatory protein